MNLKHLLLIAIGLAAFECGLWAQRVVRPNVNIETTQPPRTDNSSGSGSGTTTNSGSGSRSGSSNSGNSSGSSTPVRCNETGVLINGVCWATCNVDSPGTFASTPESYGKFYQWNRRKAWSAQGETVSGWDSTVPESAKWTRENDPCPAGWRVPTFDEFKTLFEPKKVNWDWTVQNGVIGFKFTDRTTGANLFLPAAGYRDGSDGSLSTQGTGGHYWCSPQDYSTEPYSLTFGSSDADWDDYYNHYGRPMRPVAE